MALPPCLLIRIRRGIRRQLSATVMLNGLSWINAHGDDLQPPESEPPSPSHMKTTLAGAALAGLSALALYQNNGGQLDDWKLWVIPVAIAVLGYLVADKPKEG